MATDSRQASPLSERPKPLPRAHFAVFQALTTRWLDNDLYGHVNNTVYYSYFDTVVNTHLIHAGALEIHAGEVIGLVVESQCHYFTPLAFPQTVHAGLRVAHLGRSSVTYSLGLFADDEPQSAAVGRFVHVYVDRATRRPVPLPDKLLAVLHPLQMTETRP
jgi:acyl-CoA thioester hydrolase